MEQDFEENYFTDYKEQTFRWEFWSNYINKNFQCPTLEIGCSYGFLYKYLRNYTGVDISKHAIKIAQKQNKEAFQVMDAEKLDFKNNQFNLILTLDLLEHLNNPENCIKECARVLKQGGSIIISTPNPESKSKRVKGKNWFAHKDKTHVSIHNANYWIKLLKKYNFVVTVNKTIDLFDFPYFNKLFILINLILYKIKKPFINKYGDNLVIIARIDKTSQTQ